MKAVILEIKDGFAAVLADNGSIVKLDDHNYTIGQVIDVQLKDDHEPGKLVIWAASVAAALLICGTSAWAFYNPYSYVSLDVNPSIEYTLNRFDRVLSVKAVNDDGQEILKEIQLNKLNYKKIEDAIDTVVDQLSKEEYFAGDAEGGIIIAASSKNTSKARKLAEGIKQRVEESNTENGDEVEVEAISVGKDRVAEARKLGVTPGKLNLIEKLKTSAADPDSIKIEDWLNKPVKDIMKATKENKKAVKSEAKTEVKAAVKADVAAGTKSAVQVEKQPAETEQVKDNNEKAKPATTAKKRKSTSVKKSSKTQNVTENKSKNVESKKENSNTKSNKEATAKPAKSNNENKESPKTGASQKPASTKTEEKTKPSENSSESKNDNKNTGTDTKTPPSNGGGIEESNIFMLVIQ